MPVERIFIIDPRNNRISWSVRPTQHSDLIEGNKLSSMRDRIVCGIVNKDGILIRTTDKVQIENALRLLKKNADLKGLKVRSSKEDLGVI